MKRPYSFLQAALLLLSIGVGSDVLAAAQRTFVASNGNDLNACTLALPCRTFGAAIAQTTSGGEVIVLDSAGYGVVTIAQPVSIVAPAGVYAGISVFSGTGITIAAAAGKVTLRGLTINALGGSTGIAVSAAAAVYVDNLIVSGFATGLAANVAASGSVYVADSVFRDNAVGASFVASSGTLAVSIEHALFERNATGVSFGARTAATMRASSVSGGTTGVAIAAAAGGAKVELRDSSVGANSGSAVAIGPAASPTAASVVSSILSENGTGVAVQGGGNSAYVSDSTITRNTQGLSTAAGAIVSGCDNRLLNNIFDGTFTSTVLKI